MPAKNPDSDESSSFPVAADPIPRRTIDAPGIYDDFPEADYHRDPCPAPSLSRSILKRLVDETPAHAHCIHPRLGGADPDDGTGDEAADIGSIVHDAFLRGVNSIRRIPFEDWRTKAAKAERALAYAAGEIPLLERHHDRVMRILEELETFRAKTGAFTHGKAEQTAVWKDGPIWCRARIDWLPDSEDESPLDLKTTTSSLATEAWSRAAFNKGCDLQDVFYCRGIEELRGVPPEPMRFVVVEQEAPFSIRVFMMSPVARELALDDVRIGASLWENCLATGSWPKYALDPEWIWPPTYVVKAREARPRRELPRGDHPNLAGYIQSGNFGG